MIYILTLCIANCTDSYEKDIQASLFLNYPKLEFKITDHRLFHDLIDPSLMILLTESELILDSIRPYAELEEVPVLVLGENYHNGQIFYSESAIDSYIKSLDSLVRTQKIKKFGLIYSADQGNLKALDYFRDRYSIVSSAVSNEIDQEKVSGLIGKFFKNRGITDYLILVDESLCSMMETGFAENKLNHAWNIMIYGKECIGKIKNKGGILIVPEGLEDRRNFTNYILEPVGLYLNLLDKEQLSKQQIYRKFREKIKDAKYSIVNIQNSSTVVGKVFENEIKIDSPIIYPSGLDYREVLSRVPIKISANTGASNPLDHPKAFQNAKYHQGTYFALNKTSRTNSNFLNFELQLFDNITCGVNYFDYNYSKNCYLEIKDELGIAHIPTFYETAGDTIKLFTDLGISIPIISGMGNDFGSVKENNYRNLFRLVRETKFCSSLAAVLLRKNTWDSLVYFYSDNQWGRTYYNNAANSAITGHLKFANQEKYRKIVAGYRPEMLNDYKNHFKDALESGCNILVLSMTDPDVYFFLESLAEYGVEEGDFFIILRVPNAEDAGLAEDANIELRKKLLVGTNIFYNIIPQSSEYINKTMSEFKESGFDTKIPGYYIDAMDLITKTLELLLHTGKDYEDTSQFINSLLQVKFNGITGRVSFDYETHLRSSYTCDSFKVHFDTNLHEYYLMYMYHLNPLSNILVVNNLVNALTSTTNFKQPYYSCPYFTENIIDSKVSSSKNFAINLAILILSILCILLLLTKIKFHYLRPISAFHYISLKDVLQMIFIIVEPIQLITIGPSFFKMSRNLAYLLNIISFNLLKFYSFRDNSYWVIYYLTLSISYFWVLLCILSTSIFKRLFKRFHNKLTGLKSFLSITISNYLYVPMLYTASSIVSCSKTEKRHLDISFLDNDCNFICWTGFHYFLITMSALIIIIMSPLGIFYRVLSQNDFSSLHVKTNGNFLIVKGIVSIITISFGKLMSDEKLAFAVSFFLILAIMLIFLLFVNPYNYDRMNLWTRIMLSCVIWHSIICIVDASTEVDETFFASIYFSGWTALLILGFLLHARLPQSFLIFKKDKSILQMIRLAFHMGYFESFNPWIRNRLMALRGGRRFK